MSATKYWLGELIDEYKPREGVFILQSTVAWAAALRFAIEERHGPAPSAQFDSCRQHFRELRMARGHPDQQGKAYCLLYHALTSSTTLVTLDDGESGRPWMYPTAVVTWYYAHYHAIQAMALARGLTFRETHASLANAINSGLRDQLPHPYNMRGKPEKLRAKTLRAEAQGGDTPNRRATPEGGGTYRIELPDARAAERVRLVYKFDETAEMAHGMLLDYLESTAKWYKKGGERKQAEEQNRNNPRVQREINFMHCAFRYRGNANYRDPLYLTYGTQARKDYGEFLHNLAVSARFAFICGLAYADRVYGADSTASFLADLGRNFRGLTRGTDAELFWRPFAASVQGEP